MSRSSVVAALLAVSLATACQTKSSSSKSTGSSATGSSASASSASTGSANAGSAVDATPVLPALKSPVTLPKVEADHARVVERASSFVTIDALGALRVGALAETTTSLDGTSATLPLGAALDAIAPPATRDTPPTAEPTSSGIGPAKSKSALRDTIRNRRGVRPPREETAPDGGTGAPRSSTVDGADAASKRLAAGGTGAPSSGFAVGGPQQGEIIRVRLDDTKAIDTLVFADIDAPAALVTDAVASMSSGRVSGVAVDGTNARFAMVATKRAPPSAIASGPVMVITAKGVEWYVTERDGTKPVASDWAATEPAFGDWLKRQGAQLDKLLVLVDSDVRWSHAVRVLERLAVAGAKTVDIGRRFAVDANGDVVGLRRPPFQPAIRVSSGDPKDEREVHRAFRQRTQQLWTCIDAARRAKGDSAIVGVITVHFTAIQNAANELTSKGIEPGVDECIGDVVREMRFGAFSSGDVVVDVKLTVPTP